jgi:bifunctional DNA-binding transcriptional regulator/antitoxin component of YhaV-PrlF toxin-antitoxin module
MTGKNQVTVPAEIVEKAGLEIGTRLEWRLTNRSGVLEIRILQNEAALAEAMRGRGRRYLRGSGSPVGRLIAERDSETSGRST